MSSNPIPTIPQDVRERVLVKTRACLLDIAIHGARAWQVLKFTSVRAWYLDMTRRALEEGYGANFVIDEVHEEHLVAAWVASHPQHLPGPVE